MQSIEDGVCVACDSVGRLGEPCNTPACARRGHHRIPPSYAPRPGSVVDGRIGLMWDEYLIVEALGAGGVGTVYGALKPPIMLQAAVKILSNEAPAPLVERFRQEAMALARLSHPNIVRILHFGERHGAPYLVMEHVPGGRTLRSVDRTRLARGEVFAILAQLCDALEAAHFVGVIHRDIKPGNVMLQELPSNPYFVRLVDFGLAKLVDQGHSTALMAGTPHYMAPEQLTQQPVGPWTDWYAFGVIAFELLTGARPYPSLSTAELVRLKVDRRYDLTEQPQFLALAPELRKVFARLLAHDAAARPATGAAVRDLLSMARSDADGMGSLDLSADTLAEMPMPFLPEIASPPVPTMPRLVGALPAPRRTAQLDLAPGPREASPSVSLPAFELPGEERDRGRRRRRAVMVGAMSAGLIVALAGGWLVDAGGEGGDSMAVATGAAVGAPLVAELLAEEVTPDVWLLSDAAPSDAGAMDAAQVADALVALDPPDASRAPRQPAARRALPAATKEARLRSKPRAPEVALEMAERALVAGRLREAERLFLEVAESPKYSVWSYRGLGHVHLKAGRLESAEYYLTLAIKESPGFARDHLYRGLARWKLGPHRAAEACSDWRQVLAMGGKYEEARAYIAERCP